MTNYKIIRIDKYGNKIPYHSKSLIDTALDYIDNAAKNLDKRCIEYVNSGKIDKHAKIAGRISEKITEVAGKSLITASRDGVQLIGAGTLVVGGAVVKDADTIKRGGKIAYNVGKERITRAAKGIKTLAKTGRYYYVNWDKLSNESKRKLYGYGITTVLGVFITAAMWHEIGLLSSEVDPVNCLYPMIDIDDIPYIDNGVYTGDDDYDLQQLISLGELDNTTHYSDIDRNMTAVNDFLNMHGISEHDGYEVHHIVPLSQGGADSPENMVLIPSDLHRQITAAHDAFYGWHS